VGLLYDYFRAADGASVAKLMEFTGGGSLLRHGQDPLADAVDAKAIDPTVVIGQLVSFALDVPWSPELLDAKLVWPADAAQDEEDEGPWVVVLAERARDALDEIADDRLPELAARWSHIEELSRYDDVRPDTMLPVLTQLVGLARRARGAGEALYCWMSL
jgi:hypothetical protein